MAKRFKQIMASHDTGIWFSHKKEWNIDPCYNVNELQDHTKNRIQTQMCTSHTNFKANLWLSIWKNLKFLLAWHGVNKLNSAELKSF
jgi:hypothetical protein